MAQALAWHARRLNVPCTVIVPETAPEVKLAGIRRYGAQVIQLSWERVWDVMTAGMYPPLKDMLYVPPFNSREMIAGNGTAGLQMFEDLPSVRTVFVPLGGGGLIAGVASALRALNPRTELVACEVEPQRPLQRRSERELSQRSNGFPAPSTGLGRETCSPRCGIA